MNTFVRFAWLIVGTALTASSHAADFYGSAATSNFVEYPLPNGPSNSTFVSIGDLAAQNGDSADHQITTLSVGPIFVVAQVHITNPAGIGVRGACRLVISDGTGPQNGLTMMGTRAAIWYTVDNPAYDLTVPVVGYATKDPGTYNVIVQCEQLAYNGATGAILDQLIVWRAGSKRDSDGRDDSGEENGPRPHSR